ncbi:hypothetical protein [Lentzea aerocolonigenes]|uniref:hypothetical protein n=1 Tax=Lentzea aerocolonigenes TaxID=68170 RepID=UPI0004C39431|nr:hypothetical protein [Lentzea aerocolonigenes]MCP2244725.1 hypothetical protein [Lentzea aerocolonigenes]
MKNNVKIAFVSAAVAALGLTACTSTPDQHAAAQTPASTPSPSVVTEVETATVTNPPKPQADGRPGYGALKLGMTLEEARATGQTSVSFDALGCASDDRVAISKKQGVIRISLPAEAKTSRGIGIGSTVAEVKKAYPNAEEYRAGFAADVDGYEYWFVVNGGFSDTGKVAGIKLMGEWGGSECAMAAL